MTKIPDTVLGPAWDAVWEAALGSQLWLVPGSSPLADTCIQLANSRQLEWLLIDDAMRLMAMEPEPGVCGSLSACVVASYGAAFNSDRLRDTLWVEYQVAPKQLLMLLLIPASTRWGSLQACVAGLHCHQCALPCITCVAMVPP